MSPGDTCRKAGTTPGHIADQRAPAAKRRMGWRKISRTIPENESRKKTTLARERKASHSWCFPKRLWKVKSKKFAPQGRRHRRSGIWAGVKPRFADCVAGPDSGPPDGFPHPVFCPRGSGLPLPHTGGPGGLCSPGGVVQEGRRPSWRGPGQRPGLLSTPPV